MNKPLITSSITLFAIVLFAATMIAVFTGSAGIRFQRNSLTGDVSTAELIRIKADKERKDMPVEKMVEEPADAAPMGGGDKVVLWVSIPGLRTDYVEKSQAPFLQEMVSNGSDTKKMKPNFPCMTAPAHATLATGTTVDVHGIQMDKMRTEDGSVVQTDGSHLKAEAIWTTATRQGVRTLVHDWPLSFKQPTENAAAISNTSYNPDLTDQQRLDALYEAWSGDKDEKKLRLIMCRLDDIEKGGMANGPRTDETYAVVAETDKALKAFIENVKQNWTTLAKKDAELIVVVTTDHGLIALDKNVNLPKLLGPKLMENVDVVAHDAIAQLYFKNLPESEGEQKLFKDKFDDAMSKYLYFRTLKPEDLPADWKFAHEGRTGDRILVLKSGYGFTDHEAEEPVFEPAEGPGLFGGFGYPVEDAFRMTGQSIVWGWPNSPGASMGSDDIDQTGFHAAVCGALEIEPSDKAGSAAFNVK